MSSRPALLALLLLGIPALSQAQGVRFGAFAGPSFVGGGGSRTITQTSAGPLTGAGQTGLHLRGFVDLPLATSAFSLRLDAFYNRLTSYRNTHAIVAGEDAASAHKDRTVGLTGSLLFGGRSSARFAPYGTLGAGFFGTALEGGPPSSSASVSANGMGLGIVAGFGATYRLAGRLQLIADFRYHQGLYNSRGSAFMPLSFGFRY